MSYAKNTEVYHLSSILTTLKLFASSLYFSCAIDSLFNKWMSVLYACVDTVKAPVSRHPREAKKVTTTGAGRSQECINTEFV